MRRGINASRVSGEVEEAKSFDRQSVGDFVGGGGFLTGLAQLIFTQSITCMV